MPIADPGKAAPIFARASFTRVAAAILALSLSACAVSPVGQHNAQQIASPRPASAPAAPPPVSATPSPAAPQPQAIVPPVVELEPRPPDKGLALREWVDRQSRLYRIAAPLLINNTELCPRHARSILGFTAKNKYSYPEDYISAAQASLLLGDQLQVMDVFPGSGASEAGLRHGDLLVAVEIEPMPQGMRAEQDAAALIGSEMQGRSVLQITVQRDEELHIVDIPATPACAMPIDLGNSDAVASYGDGQRVMVTHGMLDLLRSDDELAYVLAREIARNVLDTGDHHEISALIERLRTIGDPEDIDSAPVAGAGAQSVDAGIGVDELALYMLARSGYALEGYLPFWDRLAALEEKEAAAIRRAALPAYGQHVAALARTIQEIKVMQAAGVPILPEPAAPLQPAPE
jgi:hypothetical protein